MTVCGGHGWVAGIASHESVSLSRDWLTSLEAPGHPWHPSSLQQDAVVIRHCKFSVTTIISLRDLLQLT